MDKRLGQMRSSKIALEWTEKHLISFYVESRYFKRTDCDGSQPDRAIPTVSINHIENGTWLFL